MDGPSINTTTSPLCYSFASLSTDANYQVPVKKKMDAHTVMYDQNKADALLGVSEYAVFKILDTLKSSSSGPDNIPSWFLKLAAPFLAKPLAHVYSLSLRYSLVPTQWKKAEITPVAKVKFPSNPSEYRPISVTSIISRSLEHHVVTSFMYPAMNNPPEGLTFSDQFAFRPTGSTTAILIALLAKTTELLDNGKMVVLVSLDFSKAFDTVRHSTLFDKLSKLDVRDEIYNWMISYFEDREHCTKFGGLVSENRSINASVVQGSGLGPFAFSTAASDLKPKNNCFSMFKFADDVDMVGAVDHYDLIPGEIQHVEAWAGRNNLVLNKSKTKEIIIRKPRMKQPPPSPTPGITRVSSLKILGVTFQDNLSMQQHVDGLIVEASNMLYAMNILRSHGMPQAQLYEVFRSKILSKFLYAAPSWWGFANQRDIDRINGFLKRSKRQKFYPDSDPLFEELCARADDNLFAEITRNNEHELHRFLPPKKIINYSLRDRKHPYTLPTKDDRNFFNRVLFKL